MALTFTTGMTLASAADSATNWNIARIAGSGQAPAFGGSDTTILKEGTASNSSKVAVANTDAVHILDWYANAEGGKGANTTVDLTASGSEVICGWVQITTVAAMRTIANGGLYLLLQSSTETTTAAPTVYSKWYVGGSDVYPGGWVFFMVDTRKTPSTTAGGGCNLAAVRRVGFGVFLTGTPGTIKADNVFVDAIWYGRPNYKVVGDGSTVANWNNFLTHSVTTTQNGLVEQIGATFFISSGIQFGDGSQGATTTFLDNTGQKLEFKRYTYYQGSIVDALNYTDYYKVLGDGAASFKTSITFGTVVGTGDDRQGVLGGSISSPDTTNLTWFVDFQTNKANLSAVKLYGLDIVGAKGGILLDNNSAATETTLVSLGIRNCGEIDIGTTGNGAEILSCVIINPLGGTNNRGLRFNGSHNIKKISFITSGTPTTQNMSHLPEAGTYSIGFNAVKFFGDYSSATLWHGEASANNSGTITLDATNQANPAEAEFHGTGTPAQTIAVNNPISLVIEIKDAEGDAITDACEVTVVKNSDETVLYNDEDVTTGSTTYNYTSGGGTIVYINVHNTSGYQNKVVNNFTLPSSGTTTLTVQLDEDRFYANPI